MLLPLQWQWLLVFLASSMACVCLDVDSMEVEAVMLLQQSIQTALPSRLVPSTPPAFLETVQGDRPPSAVGKEDGCMTDDVQALLSGLEKAEKHPPSGLGLPAIALLALSLVVLLMGHRLVTPVILITTGLAAFYFMFELLRSTVASCAAPVIGAAVVALLAAGVACCFLELAMVIPGGMFGVVLAYEVQTLLLSASSELRTSTFMVRYFWLIALASGLLFAWVAHKLREDIFILVTSVLGSFGTLVSLRAVLLDYAHVKMTDLAAFITLLVALIIGLVYQHKLQKRD